MDMKELKKELKEVQLQFTSLFNRSVKHIITTGTNTVFFTNIHPEEISDNDLTMKMVVSRVELHDIDLLAKYIPFLTMPNLCIHRDRVATVLNKATTGADITVTENKLPPHDKSECFDGVEDTKLRYLVKYTDGVYGQKIQTSDKEPRPIKCVVYMEALDKEGKRVSINIGKDNYQTIPVGDIISETTVAWFANIFLELPELTNSRDIRLTGDTNLCYIKAWEGVAVPYADGISGVSINGYLKKVLPKDSDALFVEGHMIQDGSAEYLVTTKHTEDFNAITVPVVFKIFPVTVDHEGEK